jgi:mono/diheme cytochrome c family protein
MGRAYRRAVLGAAVVAASVALLALASSPVGGVAGFGDIEDGRFYTAPVQWMVDEGITTGTDLTCYSPDEPVTRGQAAAFLWRMEGRPAPVTPHSFSDVTAPWQQDPVSWMAENGITTGTTATTYSPDDEATRGQIAALLHRLAGSPEPVTPHSFTDVSAPWQQDPVSWMAENGITTGTTATTYSPDDEATRAQMAALLYRYKGSPPVVIDPTSPFCAPPTTTTTTTTVAPPSGSAIFSANCAICHGAGGSGGFGPRLIGNTLSYSAIRSQIVNGGGGMPSFSGTLSSAQIDRVASYVSGL